MGPPPSPFTSINNNVPSGGNKDRSGTPCPINGQDHAKWEEKPWKSTTEYKWSTLINNNK